ncbi:MAG: DUF2277 domain-containing protein [Pseudomonadales bacterium]|jgi:hypothetical protein|nr:DUF2277 domain-containing protein [Pseudomonadales bacterium]MDP6471157.1 DUF2277 domain-containing protein [Pseudomonadales bacterium]MDP6825656.1 DUF2277 domain-containing protein [Pseudomonadales bacterium]MDP6971625.1 DUF2277 domain-containing protein [Pseudomonadales bacterium]|tara:strand:+ start:2076 stop:2378 length:303 start_codon:yes stop_codon:yes gene_type:complete
MYRNIRTLYNFEPPGCADEIQAAALQYVRKVSVYAKPSQANRLAFKAAVEDIGLATERLLAALLTSSQPQNREAEAEKARIRARKRFAWPCRLGVRRTRR